MNWLRDPELDVKPWQVDDYRQFSLNELWGTLEEIGILLDKQGFLAYTERFENPDDLSDCLTNDEWEPEQQDHAYLVIFELWRRLVPDTLCLSIFCDEIDHQIDGYDQASDGDNEGVQDLLENLLKLLDENVDAGGDPQEIFDEVSAVCANDVEAFLFDFISEQLDDNHVPYSLELLEGFSRFVSDQKWFDFLKARILADSDPKQAGEQIREIMEVTQQEPNLELNLEILASLAKTGENGLFRQVVQQSLPILEVEEDFQDLLQICADYALYEDQEDLESILNTMIQKRPQNHHQENVSAQDSDVQKLRQLLRLTPPDSSLVGQKPATDKKK